MSDSQSCCCCHAGFELDPGQLPEPVTSAAMVLGTFGTGRSSAQARRRSHGRVVVYESLAADNSTTSDWKSFTFAGVKLTPLRWSEIPPQCRLIYPLHAVVVPAN